MGRTLPQVLRSDRGTILRLFALRLTRDDAVEVPHGTCKSEVIDHLPSFLDALADMLEVDAAPGPDAAERPSSALIHGLQRYDRGFDLGSVVREYGILRECILHVAHGLGGGHSELETAALARHVDAGIASAVHAFTEQKHEALERAVRAREEAVATVSHDMRSPLTSIVLAAAGLANEATDPARVRQLAAHILDAAQSMERMTRDLGDLTLIDSGKMRVVPTRVEAVALLESTASTFQETASARGVSLVVGASDGRAACVCDASHAQRVLTNLVENALKYTPRGGRVVIEAKVERAEVIFRVADTGHGIAKEHLDRIFERGWRAPDATGPGSGIGLHIAQGLVEVAGGRMGVDSEIGKGTTFWFALPGENGA